jgi:hypothetical protein
MTSRTARSLTLVAGLAIVVAACGGSSGASGPATQGPATQAPTTQAPATRGPAATGGLQSIDTSSFHADQDLEALMPKDIGGEPVTVLSMTGDAFLIQGSSPEFEAALAALGKTAADLSVAFGGNTKITIIAFQVDGAPADQILNALFTAYQQSTQATVTDVTISGKAVKKITPASTAESLSYIYAVRDVVFSVGGTALTEALLNETFQKLP